MRNSAQGVSFVFFEGHFKSDFPQCWDAVADIKHPRHEEALSGVKASKKRKHPVMLGCCGRHQASEA